ncbi:oligosaccharide flippase family protein [Acinetobacter venetianus]|uniref:oligosaccharide flippase family protein n=1 Tax=Acinetobacter venetianus TaxID=52133 RepID=UPI003A924C6A
MKKKDGLLKGASAFLVINYVSAGFSFIILVVNGKILSAEDYGIIGLAMVLVSILESFKQLGFKEYLIAIKSVSSNDEDNAWSIDLVKALALSMILFFSSGAISSYYDEPKLKFVVLCFSVIFVLEGLSSPKIYQLRKHLKYKELIKFNLYGNLIYLIGSISLVYLFESYIGVVFAYLLKGFSNFILSYIYCPCIPRFFISSDLTKKQIKFGVWIFASSIVFYITNRFDAFVLSTKVDIISLGYYSFAYALVNGLVSQPAKSFNNALFPLLSKGLVSSNPTRIFLLLLIASFFIGLALHFIIPFVLIYVIDKKWEVAIPCIQILIFAFLVNGLKFDSYFMANGKTKLKFIIELSKGIAFLSIVFPLVDKFGIEGAAMSILISNLFSLFVWLLVMRNINVSKNI